MVGVRIFLNRLEVQTLRRWISLRAIPTGLGDAAEHNDTVHIAEMVRRLKELKAVHAFVIRI